MLTIKYIGKRDILNFFELTQVDQGKMMKEYSSLLDYEDQSYFLNRFNEPELFEFLRIDNFPDFKSFHGYISDSFFGGSLCILDKDCDSFKLFDYCS